MTLSFYEQHTIELEPKLITTAYLLTTVEKILFKLFMECFYRRLATRVLVFKLMGEFDGSFCSLIA